VLRGRRRSRTRACRTIRVSILLQQYCCIQRLTSSRKVPNKAQKRKGPARSASSMIWLSILAMGLRTVRVYHSTTLAFMMPHNILRRDFSTHLHLYMPKIHAQLFQQRWLPFISFSPKRRQPSRSQSSLTCPHLPAGPRLSWKSPKAIVR
jgi:hypothetical protein